MGIKTTSIEILLILVFIVISFLAVSGSLTDNNVATRALEAQGMTNIKVLDTSYFFMWLKGGAETDSIRYECEATSPAGKRIRVYVFTGLFFKGATVRTF